MLDSVGVRTILPRLLFRRLGSGSRRVAAAPLLAAVLDGEERVADRHLLDPALADVYCRLARLEGWIARILAGNVAPTPAALVGNRTNLERLAAELEQITHAPGKSPVGIEELAERIAIAQDRLEELGASEGAG